MAIPISASLSRIVGLIFFFFFFFYFFFFFFFFFLIFLFVFVFFWFGISIKINLFPPNSNVTGVKNFEAFSITIFPTAPDPKLNQFLFLFFIFQNYFFKKKKKDLYIKYDQIVVLKHKLFQQVLH